MSHQFRLWFKVWFFFHLFFVQHSYRNLIIHSHCWTFQGIIQYLTVTLRSHSNSRCFLGVVMERRSKSLLTRSKTAVCTAALLQLAVTVQWRVHFLLLVAVFKTCSWFLQNPPRPRRPVLTPVFRTLSTSFSVWSVASVFWWYSSLGLSSYTKGILPPSSGRQSYFSCDFMSNPAVSVTVLSQML